MVRGGNGLPQGASRKGQAGGNLYYGLIVPFVEAALAEGQGAVAKNALAEARRTSWKRHLSRAITHRQKLCLRKKEGIEFLRQRLPLMRLWILR